MIRVKWGVAAAVAAGLLAVGCVGPRASAQAATGTTATTPPQPKMHAHNSNTLHKIGKAIQYTTRKDTTNLSVDVHKAIGHKSVVRNRQTGNNFVEKPNGHTILKSSTNPYMHGVAAHHTYYHHGHYIYRKHLYHGHWVTHKVWVK